MLFVAPVSNSASKATLLDWKGILGFLAYTSHFSTTLTFDVLIWVGSLWSVRVVSVIGLVWFLNIRSRKKLILRGVGEVLIGLKLLHWWSVWKEISIGIVESGLWSIIRILRWSTLSISSLLCGCLRRVLWNFWFFRTFVKRMFCFLQLTD